MCSQKFPIFDISSEEPEERENTGSKYKFWYREKGYLYKESTANTGEDWGASQ